jgi:hypothetical protein
MISGWIFCNPAFKFYPYVIRIDVKTKLLSRCKKKIMFMFICLILSDLRTHHIAFVYIACFIFIISSSAINVVLPEKSVYVTAVIETHMHDGNF